MTMSLVEILLYCKPTNISLDCPAGAPPQGQIPLDPNAYSLVPLTVGVSVACCDIILIAMSIRFFTRAYLVKTFALEDALLLFAAITFFGFTATILISVPMGLRKHTWNTTSGQLLRIVRIQYAAQIIYVVHSYPAKLASVLQIKHVFTSGQERGLIYWSSWATIVFLTCLYTTVLFVVIFPCTPMKKAWNPWMKDGWCMDKAVPGTVGAIGNFVSDVVVLALPVVSVANLQMKLKQKIAVAAVFTTGLIACVASALRLHYTLDKELKEDIVYWIVVQAICAALEAVAVMLCCCFPTFPRFLDVHTATRPKQDAGNELSIKQERGN